MDAKVLVINDACERQCVKDVHDAKVHILVVFFAAFLVKVKTLGHLSRFMIASQEKDVIFVLEFHCHE